METLICIILCLLSMAVFFLSKFKGRKDKTVEPTLKYWITDNWVDLIVAIIVTTIGMTLMLYGAMELKLDELLKEQNLPFLIVVAPKPMASVLIGFYLTKWGYGKVKVKANEE